jgi:hypothetical protein
MREGQLHNAARYVGLRQFSADGFLFHADDVSFLVGVEAGFFEAL